MKRGSATLFRRTKGAWTERATLVAADSAAGDECGVSVALGSGGAPGASLALVGGVRGGGLPPTTDPYATGVPTGLVFPRFLGLAGYTDF